MQTLSAAAAPPLDTSHAREPATSGQTILALDLGTTTGWAFRTATA